MLVVFLVVAFSLSFSSLALADVTSDCAGAFDPQTCVAVASRDEDIRSLLGWILGAIWLLVVSVPFYTTFMRKHG
jgi:hypothetical protein